MAGIAVLGFSAGAGERLRSERTETDVFAIMAEAARLEAAPLWPGFASAGIPVALFDDNDTYVFNFPRLPKGFRELKDRPGVAVYRGQYPTVFGNRRIQIDGVWTATVLPRAFSPELGRAYSLSEIAGVVVHEKFHVFQALRHPEWRPNDAVLMDYPLDTPASLGLRRMETAAWQRAVAEHDPRASVGWAKRALKLRGDRLSRLEERHAVYEREVQRFEGLAEYVEYLASGRGNFDGPPMTGFAPGAAREMGYRVGRWLAVLLDRFDPGWKERLENGEFEYLERRLAARLAAAPETDDFSEDELAAFRQGAGADLLRKGEERKARLGAFLDRLGSSIEFFSATRPLHLEMFDPLTMEAVGPRTMLHLQWLILKNENGIVEVINRPCLTEIDARGRVVRFLITGVTPRIPVQEWHGRMTVAVEGITAAFKSARVAGHVDRIRVYLN